MGPEVHLPNLNLTSSIWWWRVLRTPMSRLFSPCVDRCIDIRFCYDLDQDKSRDIVYDIVACLAFLSRPLLGSLFPRADKVLLTAPLISLSRWYIGDYVANRSTSVEDSKPFLISFPLQPSSGQYCHCLNTLSLFRKRSYHGSLTGQNPTLDELDNRKHHRKCTSNQLKQSRCPLQVYTGETRCTSP